jgi:GNAT superfamily N-acetyltransferase
MPAVSIRVASPDDIDEMIAIDDDACTLFTDIDMHLELERDHPYVVAEREHWLRCARGGWAFVAGEPQAPAVGLLIMDRVDGAPYLEQLSVRRRAMGGGLGRRLLLHAIGWASGQPLWLTTYAHIPWNGPFYARHGFDTVDPRGCGPEISARLEAQRAALPAPEQRVAMRFARPPRPA